jgi:hypothetical protein
MNMMTTSDIMEKLKEDIERHDVWHTSYKIYEKVHEDLVWTCKTKLDQTNCKASDVEKVQLHLLRQKTSDPDWCHHAECAAKDSECKALHLEMRQNIMIMNRETHSMRTITITLQETALRIILHAAETNDVGLLEWFIWHIRRLDKEDVVGFMFNEYYRTTGKTGLHLAVERGHIEIIKLLLPEMSKIGINRLDANRNSAYVIALRRRDEKNMKEICQLINEYA